MTRTHAARRHAKKGAFILESDAARRDWDVRGPLCEGWPIHDLIVEPGSGRDPRRRRQPVVRPGGLAQRGPAATTWTHSSAGMTYGDEGPRSRPSGAWRRRPMAALLAGVEPAGLFRSPTAARRGPTSRA